jgi:hypothetical protein
MWKVGANFVRSAGNGKRIYPRFFHHKMRTAPAAVKMIFLRLLQITKALGACKKCVNF